MARRARRTEAPASCRVSISGARTGRRHWWTGPLAGRSRPFATPTPGSEVRDQAGRTSDERDADFSRERAWVVGPVRTWPLAGRLGCRDRHPTGPSSATGVVTSECWADFRRQRASRRSCRRLSRPVGAPARPIGNPTSGAFIRVQWTSRRLLSSWGPAGGSDGREARNG